MTTEQTDRMSPQEQATAFVREQFDREREAVQTALDSALQLEEEVAKEAEKLGEKAFALAKRDLDGELDAEEREAQRLADAANARLRGVSRAITMNRDKLALMNDGEFDRRVKLKVEQLVRGRTSGEDNDNNGKRGKKKMAKQPAPTRVPVPEATVSRVVDLVKTKSQQEVADLLNKEGKTTASGKPWTPQNIWHLVKKATGKGVPRKSNGKKATAKKATPKKATAAKNGNGKKTTATKTAVAKAKSTAKPLSKEAQGAGTSRGGTGSKKKPSTSRRVGR